MKTLRKYQIDDDARIETALKQYQGVLYQLTMGGGKSVVATNVISRRKDKNVIVFAHKRRLLTQLENHFSGLGVKVGVLGGGREDNLDANIVIVSIRTAGKDNRLEALLERSWDFVFIDEARHSRTKTYDKVIAALKEHNPMIQLFGVDATPWRKDKKRLDFHFDHMVVSSTDTASLMEKGWLQDIKTIVCPFSIDDLRSEVHEVANDYQAAELSKYMRKQKYLDFLVTQYVNYGEERSAIVFAVDKAHAQSIVEVFQKNGYEGKVAKVDSSMTSAEVDAVFSLFESGDVQILVNVEMVTEGVDLPIAGCIVGARPTKSLSLYMQMPGRGTRPDGINDYFIMLDCCGWTQEFGSIKAPREWSLNPEIDPNNARIGYKILGKKDDGTFTENIEDFDGEIIEMSPEEYFEQLTNGHDQAQVHNKSVEEKIEDVCIQITTILFEGKEDWKKKYRFTKYDTYRGNLEIRLSVIDRRSVDENGEHPVFKYKYMDINIKNIEKSARGCYVQVSGSGLFDEDLIEESYGWQINIGQIYATLANKKKTIEDVKGLAATVKQYENKIIDLRVFEQRKREMEEKQFLEDVTNYAKDKDFVFVQPVDATSRVDVHNHFKDTGGWRGLYYRPIKGIQIKGGLKGHHNTIILHVEDHSKEIQTIEKAYVKGEKVLELIKLLQWKRAE